MNARDALPNELALIEIGITSSGTTVGLPLKRGNRHGLIAGSTGSGKTTTVQRMIEGFSAAGVPVFATDIKSDLSGACTAVPVQFWDLYGTHGLPIRTSVQEMGALLLSSMLQLNEVQAGTLAIIFKKSEDEQDFMLSLDDLRFNLIDALDNREAVCSKYGNISAASVNAIQRNLLTLEEQGGFNLFGEPGFSIDDLMRTDAGGRGIVNLLDATQLMRAPKVYATFLLWLLTEIFRVMPEAGDLNKPKLVFFIDEAHLIFRDAPKPLLDQIERLVRLVRSKGVGIFFATQSVSDIPETVLAQLGSKIQHALRVFTPKDQKMIRATAASFRENRGVDVKAGVTTLAVGEAYISVIDEEGVPTKVEKIRVTKPSGQLGPISTLEREVILKDSPLRTKYSYPLWDGEAAKAFDNRMRQERGLPPIAANGDWPEGTYAKYVPDLTVGAVSNRARGIALRRIASAVLLLAGSFGLLYISTHV
jgi:DNA helicase HerA-like ATPase